MSPPNTPLLVGLGTYAPQAGAPPRWDHPSSREHTCHCAGAQPAADTGPSLGNNARLHEGALQWGRTGTTQTPTLHVKKGEKYFSAAAASTVRQRRAQGMPGPPLTCLSLSGARRPRCAPRPPPSPAPAAAPQPGAHLRGSGFRRSSSLAAECGAAAAAAATAFPATAAVTEALPGAPPGLEAGGPRDPRRRGAGTRRGRAAGSYGREARCEREASHPRPSSRNFVAWVAARSGAEGGESGARALGRARLRSRQDWNLNGPREPGEGGAGGDVYTARVACGG